MHRVRIVTVIVDERRVGFLPILSTDHVVRLFAAIITLSLGLTLLLTPNCQAQDGMIDGGLPMLHSRGDSGPCEGLDCGFCSHCGGVTSPHGLNSDDIDVWEINEAFAVQVLACLAAWQSDDYCRDVLKQGQAFIPIDGLKLNIDGGGISLGHPVGASGARIMMPP